jgi:hypothetical protein
MQIDVFFQKNKKCFTRGEKDEVISEKAEGLEGGSPVPIFFLQNMRNVARGRILTIFV